MIDDVKSASDNNCNSKTQTSEDSSPAVRQPLRQATVVARQKLKEWLSPSENFAVFESVAISTAMLTCDRLLFELKSQLHV